VSGTRLATPPDGATAVLPLVDENELRLRLADTVRRGARHVIVDLGDAEMVGSRTLADLRGAARALRPTGSRLSVVCGHRGLARLLRLTLLSRSFGVFRSLEAARRAP
jgi:anti-anti-sigma regulatory factor